MKVICVCLMLLPLSVIAQNTDSIIKNIRSEYKTIVDNKSKYKKIDVNVWYAYSGDGDDPDVKKVITYYVEGDEIKLISVSNKYTVWNSQLELIEYYMKDNNVFFVYQQYKNIIYEGPLEWEERTTEATENRYYFEANQPIKCLTKKVKGKLSEIDILLQKENNKEEDCSQIWNIGVSLIYDFSEEDINFLYECYRKNYNMEKIIIRKF